MHKTFYNTFIYFMQDVKIRTKIFLFLSVSLVSFTIILSVSMFKRMENVLNTEFGNSMLQVLDQINNNIDYSLYKSEISLESFFAGDRFDAIIPKVIYDYNDMLLYFKAVRDQITTFRSVNEDVEDLKVFSFDDKIPWDNTSIFSAGEISNEQWAQSLLQYNNLSRFYWTNRKDGTWGKDDVTPVISCYTTVFNNTDKRPMAILRIDVETERVFGSINTVAFGKSGIVFAANDKGDLIYYDSIKKRHLGDYRAKIKETVSTGKRKGIFTANINGAQELIVYSNYNKLGWYIVGTLPQNEFREKTNDIRSFITLLSLILCSIGFLCTFMFSKFVTKRITMLSKAIDVVAERGFNAEVEIPGNDEVGQVSRHFEDMVSKIKELVSEVEEQYKKESILLNEKYELEMMKREAELCALQTQINPHFLYNTLEMLRGLLFSEDPKGNIIKATSALSSVFRYNLNTGYRVKVKDELKHIENYLTIHNLRFSRGVKLVNNIDEEGMESFIVRFSFEPIFENAILHGFRGSKKENCIILESILEDSKRSIYVKDNGTGINKNDLDEIRQMLQGNEYSFEPDRKGGLGILNVNGRIKRYFGAEYGIDIMSSAGEGTTVIITLPGEQSEK